jgi:uncharacterized protein YigE (DUF2233 family)
LASAASVQSAPTTGAEALPFPGMRTFRRKFVLADTEVLLRDVHMSREFANLLTSEHAELVINGGFFGGHDEPLGFAMSEGHVLAAPRPALSGGVLLIDGGTATLVASEDFTRPAHPAGFAVQCRPRLVVRGHVNVRSDDGKRAERTALCITDQAHAVEVIIVRGIALGDGPSLLDLARYAQSSKCEEALALDGGPSTGYAEQAHAPVPGTASDQGSTAPRGAVRHAIVFRKKR